MADGCSVQVPEPQAKVKKESVEMANEAVDEFDCFGRPGSQIDNKVEFKNRFGEVVSGIPIIVDFRRVLQLGQVSESNGVIAGVSNRDLLHAVVGLYDICLPDMESETIYSTVCAKWARTIVLVQDLKDTADEMTERNIKKRKDKNENVNEEEEKPASSDWKDRFDEKEDTYKEEEGATSPFVEAFSDTDEEEDDDEEEEESEDENFTKGIFTFLSGSVERRKQRKSCNGIIPSSMIGIESRLLACATFEKKFVEHKDRVIHLTLISVRPRYRKFRMGRYLLSKCVAPQVVGHHEAIVVHADNSAVEFFRKFGFSEDIILNSKWTELAEAFTNCTLMTYLPGFSGYSLLYTDVTKSSDPDLYEIDQELKIWQAKSREAYQGQLCCAMKFRNEILQLKHLVKSQNELLNKFVADHDKVRREKLIVEKDLLSLKLSAAQNAYSQAAKKEEETGSLEINTDELIHELENQVAALTASRQSSARYVRVPSPQPIVQSSSPFAVDSNTDIITRFIEGMEIDRSIRVNYTVSSILKTKDNPALRSRFEASIGKMKDPAMLTELYYCGSLEKPSRLPLILNNGFTEDDFTHGEFGLGLYFSKYPSKAAQFATLGKLLEVRVGLGKVETVMRYDRTRKSPSDGHDSIITPGRLYRPGDQGEIAMLCQEYVIFNIDQLLPLCIISYSAYPNT